MITKANGPETDVTLSRRVYERGCRMTWGLCQGYQGFGKGEKRYGYSGKPELDSDQNLKWNTEQLEEQVIDTPGIVPYHDLSKFIRTVRGNQEPASQPGKPNTGTAHMATREQGSFIITNNQKSGVMVNIGVAWPSASMGNGVSCKGLGLSGRWSRGALESL